MHYLNFYVKNRQILITKTQEDLPRVKLIELIYFALDKKELFIHIDLHSYYREFIFIFTTLFKKHKSHIPDYYFFIKNNELLTHLEEYLATGKSNFIEKDFFEFLLLKYSDVHILAFYYALLDVTYPC